MLVYNPEIAPQIIGSHCIPAKGYLYVEAGVFDLLRASGANLLFQGDQGFPELWVRYGTPFR